MEGDGWWIEQKLQDMCQYCSLTLIFLDSRYYRTLCKEAGVQEKVLGASVKVSSKKSSDGSKICSLYPFN